MRSRVRPVNAAGVAAGPNALRGSGPNRSHALERALPCCRAYRIVAIRKEDEDDPPPVEVGSLYSIPIETMNGIRSEKQELRPGSKACEHNLRNGYAIVSVSFGEVLEDEPVIPSYGNLWNL